MTRKSRKMYQVLADEACAAAVDIEGQAILLHRVAANGLPLGEFELTSIINFVQHNIDIIASNAYHWTKHRSAPLHASDYLAITQKLEALREHAKFLQSVRSAHSYLTLDKAHIAEGAAIMRDAASDIYPFIARIAGF